MQKAILFLIIAIAQISHGDECNCFVLSDHLYGNLSFVFGGHKHTRQDRFYYNVSVGAGVGLRLGERLELEALGDFHFLKNMFYSTQRSYGYSYSQSVPNPNDSVISSRHRYAYDTTDHFEEAYPLFDLGIKAGVKLGGLTPFVAVLIHVFEGECSDRETVDYYTAEGNTLTYDGRDVDSLEYTMYSFYPAFAPGISYTFDRLSVSAYYSMSFKPKINIRLTYNFSDHIARRVKSHR